MTWGAVSGFASGLLLLQDRRRGVDLDALILEASTIVYFVLVGAVAVARPHSSLSHHTDVLSFAWLAATAWGTLAIRRPFTLGIASCAMPVRLPWGRGPHAGQIRRGGPCSRCRPAQVQ
ncbi:hypothetical protein [Streptomyces barringtoniae]|uniref:hypothetical protein n=1 Tax=Streptomyces barringtoniae TaxID=2892029 RepID=UPI001E490731|nr:hypothetical protein [Streptomyces barringtoniae]MCC5479189.1 hypothetical protein [Streptomyces barringtoniae]